jgi:PAS domain S-box-containing protein
MHPDDATRILPYWEHCCRTGDPYEGEVRYRRHDGEYRWHIFRAFPERGADGRIQLWYGCSIDVHKEKTSEHLLRESEQRLRLALDASGAATWTYTVTTRELHADDRVFAQLGLEPGAPNSYEAWVERIHVDDRAACLGRLQQVIEGPGDDIWDHVFRIVRPKGEIRWIEILGRAVRDNEGHATKVHGISLDVTERRQAEEARLWQRDAERQRGQNEAFQSAMRGEPLETSLGALARATALYFDGDAAAAFYVSGADGATLRHVVGMSETYARDVDGFRIGPDSLACGLAIYTGEPVITPDVTRDPLWRPWRWLAEKHGYRACWSFPVRTGGPILGSLAVYFEQPRDPTPADHEWIRGITHAATIILSRDSEAAELKERTTQLSRLASDLTLAEQRAREQLAKTLHDGLQQQLAVAALHVEQQLNRDAERGLPTAPLVRVKQELDEAITAARSLSVELSPPVLQGAGLPTALAWLADWSRRTYGLEVHVSADSCADSPRKDIRTLLFESVRELLFNVIKHAQVDQVTVDLSRDANGNLRITVADRGVGFDPVELTMRANTGQVGWGLFSIRERLTLLGGQFEIESARGRGTRFCLIAPSGTEPGEVVADSPSTHAVMGPVSAAGAAGVSPARPLRILVVDDHTAVRQALRELLEEQLEFQVVGEAANGLEAVAQACLLRPDVMLMDVSMPEMGGVEATALIHAELPAIQIFGLSTQERIADLHAIEQAGGVGYFFKGTNVKAMMDRLRQVRPPLIDAAPLRDRY